MSVGHRIKQLRMAKGWSQAEIARRIDSTRVNINRYEHSTSMPPLDILVKLADLFEVTTDYLLVGKNNNIDLQDKELLDYFQIADKLPSEKKRLIKDLIKSVSESS